MNKKNILLGVCGSIACFKSLELISVLRQDGYNVKVIYTKAAQEFVTPLAFNSMLGGNLAYGDAEGFCDPLLHIELANWAHVFAVVPATAATMAKMATGAADNLLLNTYLALRAHTQVVIAPAMNPHMWQHPATQGNARTLLKRGHNILGPVLGRTCCGEEGLGRLMAVKDIADGLETLTYEKPMLGKKLVVTAGPTVEAIDSVRYISNHSSGLMGYSLARAAARLGAEVTLISGPTDLEVPFGCAIVPVETAKEMHAAVVENSAGSDMLIMAAAVSDFLCDPLPTKLSKADVLKKLKFRSTVDILARISGTKIRPKVCVGFALEEEVNLLDKATQKLDKKKADYIVANAISSVSGMKSLNNEVTILSAQGKQKKLELGSKKELAFDILHFLLQDGAFNKSVNITGKKPN